jgi:hypothetical protein
MIWRMKLWMALCLRPERHRPTGVGSIDNISVHNSIFIDKRLLIVEYTFVVYLLKETVYRARKIAYKGYNLSPSSSKA